MPLGKQKTAVFKPAEKLLFPKTFSSLNAPLFECAWLKNFHLFPFIAILISLRYVQCKPGKERKQIKIPVVKLPGAKWFTVEPARFDGVRQACVFMV